jgi:acetyltransferase-like isoleucine patch superfamily enzyme
VKEALRALTRLGPVRAAVRLVLLLTDGFSRLASVLRTAAIFPGNRLPFCHWSVTVKYAENIKLGAGVVIGPNTTLGAMGGITLEDFVRISDGVLIETAGLDLRGPLPYTHIARPIVVERGVWIGARAIILGGVTIGEGSIVGAGAVVTQSIPANTVVVGPGSRLLDKKPDSI